MTVVMDKSNQTDSAPGKAAKAEPSTEATERAKPLKPTPQPVDLGARATLEQVDLDKIDPHPRNPRIGGLRPTVVHAIAAGLIQQGKFYEYHAPIGRRKADGRIETVKGHHQIAGANLARLTLEGLTRIPMWIVADMTDEEADELLGFSNVQGELSNLEIAAHSHQVVDKAPGRKGMGLADYARRMGIHAPALTRYRHGFVVFQAVLASGTSDKVVMGCRDRAEHLAVIRKAPEGTWATLVEQCIAEEWSIKETLEQVRLAMKADEEMNTGGEEGDGERGDDENEDDGEDDDGQEHEDDDTGDDDKGDDDGEDAEKKDRHREEDEDDGADDEKEDAEEGDEDAGEEEDQDEDDEDAGEEEREDGDLASDERNPPVAAAAPTGAEAARDDEREPTNEDRGPAGAVERAAVGGASALEADRVGLLTRTYRFPATAPWFTWLVDGERIVGIVAVEHDESPPVAVAPPRPAPVEPAKVVEPPANSVTSIPSASATPKAGPGSRGANAPRTVADLLRERTVAYLKRTNQPQRSLVEGGVFASVQAASLFVTGITGLSQASATRLEHFLASADR
jgi:hypothetical protein